MQRYTIDVGGNVIVVSVDETGTDQYRVVVDGQELEVRLLATEETQETSAEAGVTGETPAQPASSEAGTGTGTTTPSHPSPVSSPDEPAQPEEQPTRSYPCESHAQATLVAPMPGVILSLSVAVGDTVTCGQTVLILEAMKMKNSLSSPQDGVVTEVVVQPGQHVNTGDVLVHLSGRGAEKS